VAVEAALNRVYFPLFVLSIAFLSFVAGSLIVLHKTFPYNYINDAYRAGIALFDQKSGYRTALVTDLWARARTTDAGVTVYDPAKAYNGLTLYTSSHAQKAFLMSMDGEVVHEWHLPFSTVWNETAAITDPQPDPFIFIENARLYPNGDLLGVYIGLGSTPWGYGLVKMNKDSEVIWTYLEHVHHDLDIGKDGKIYTLTQSIESSEIERAAHMKPPRLDDFLVVLSPEGKELKKISLVEAFAKSDYLRLLSTVVWYSYAENGDYLHANSVEVIEGEDAERLPFASEGQVLLSFREIGTIAVLDIEKEEIVWALRGPWLGQHDPDILANGNMLLFDNFGHYGTGGLSRVIEFNPATSEIVWTYAGDENHLFESRIRSNQERLPNGNTLITESDGGRLIEVTPDHEIVWEFVNPVRGGENDEMIPVVSWGQRIEPGSLDPDFLEQ
jgi:hypothetical protein